MQLEGKNILVLGMGKTGIATARFAAMRGARVYVTDQKPRETWGEAFDQIEGLPGVTVFKGSADALDGIDVVAPSPGIPPHHATLVAAVQQGIPIVSEIELAYRFIDTPMVAVTGTNGKTTTTTLLGKMLTDAGKTVFVGGNIGTPLIEYTERGRKDDWIVAEISSFQLQWIETFRPHAACMLNITRDHTDYHGSFEAYARAKARIFENQQPQDLAVLNADDPEQRNLASSIRARVEYFSSKGAKTAAMSRRDDELVYDGPAGGEERYALDALKLPGLHNVENVMAAVMLARFCGCSSESVWKTVSRFRGLPHRVEFAGEKNGVRFYDDSKGTNVDAVIRALETFSAPMILLLGGRDKDGDFSVLKDLLYDKTRLVVLFGEARDRIEAQIAGAAPLIKEGTLGEAVQRAWQNATSGDVVLLSPGCASFDEFRDYRHRGDEFKSVVGAL